MSSNSIRQGDYVSHYQFPSVIWMVTQVEPYISNGGEARLKWVGGEMTYNERCQILSVYRGGDTALIKHLRPANPMFVIAYSSK